MSKLKGQAKITLANEGSLIQLEDLSPKMREAYMKSSFGIEGKPKSVKIQRQSNEQPGKKDGGGEYQGGVSKYAPSPEDFIRVPFRFLSATIVAAYSWRATDFTDESVLKKGVAKLIGKTAFTEHWQSSSNQIGVIESAAWDKAKEINGQKIPAGINGVYLIDAKMNEKLARGLLMTPPAIYSNSVTVEFQWESTHEFENEDEFIRNLGKVQSDGRMAARKVTEIVDFHESSILWLGADPFAKMLDENGNPMNVDKGSVFEQSSSYAKSLYENEKKMFVSCSFKKDGISLNIDKELLGNENSETTEMEKKLLELTRQLLGLSENEEITQAHLDAIELVKKEEKASFASHKATVETFTQLGITKESFEALQTEKANLTNEVATLKQDKTDLEAKLTAKEELATIGEGYLNAKRTEVERLYKLQMGNKADDAVLNLIKEAKDTAAIDGLLAQYTKGVKEKFTATCTECKSEKVEFRSSLATEENPADNIVESDEEFRQNFKNSI